MVLNASVKGAKPLGYSKRNVLHNGPASARSTTSPVSAGLTPSSTGLSPPEHGLHGKGRSPPFRTLSPSDTPVSPLTSAIHGAKPGVVSLGPGGKKMVVKLLLKG
ncbi:hypothetical protein DIPPA_06830 [Diplonema papillatum]|nr:hypothetical protein DIPPA_06830 [Diplonema papillatum]